jgi:hypothetical protein
MLNLLLRPDSVAAMEALAVQRFEQNLAGGRAKSREQLTMEITTKMAELNTIRLLRPLPIGPGAMNIVGEPTAHPGTPAP